MTKTEAHQIIRMSLRSIRDRRLYEAVQIALYVLAWESAHEKLMTYEQEIIDENQHI